MRKANIFYNNKIFVGILIEEKANSYYVIQYDKLYNGPPLSLTMPIDKKRYEFTEFPPFFEGVLPEGLQLESLLKLEKLNRNDYFSQLMVVGKDLVGAFSVKEVIDA
tara:strand:- start:1030 stop:1350 length:321 start_codon:yes stop_codon:yes gene_type:complete